MVEQTGLTRCSGSMGGVRHFKIKGLSGDFAGLNGCATGEQIKSALEFARILENLNKSGGCATVRKSIRTRLS